MTDSKLEKLTKNRPGTSIRINLRSEGAVKDPGLVFPVCQFLIGSDSSGYFPFSAFPAQLLSEIH